MTFNKKNLLRISSSIALLGMVFALSFGVAEPVSAVACVNNTQCVATPTTPICSNNVCVGGGQWFRDVINRFLNFVVWPIFIALAIIMFVYAGIQYLSAHGDPAHISAAHKAVIWGLVGIAVGILGFAATGTIRVILGL